MKLPRDVSGNELVRGLSRVGYAAVRQKGDHVYMTTHVNGEHHVAIPLHKPVKVGTLSAIIGSVTAHLQITRETLFEQMKL